MTQDASTYLDLVTSEHNDKPAFMQVIDLYAQAFTDVQNTSMQLITTFDLDVAVGQGLDYLGLLIGAKRTINVNGLGTQTLDDETYRIVLKARIAANYWDGTVPGMYSVWAIAFSGLGFTLAVQDNQDMSMYVVLYGTVPSPIVVALLTSGVLTLKSAGVRIRNYLKPSVPNTPVFGFGVNNSVIAGFGIGSWAVPLT